MKTFIIIVVTAAITWIAVSFVHAIRTRVERVWLISAIKAPGRMALTEIQTDMKEGSYDLAKAKMDVLMNTWQRFDSGPHAFSGLGIGDIIVAFRKLETNSNSPLAEP